ncbi:helix-turn-helix transcriptional regulator [Kocuria coralli]|uniref:Helix-turn-helix transcriptional regulator n=1 Tax=Kocuria coralli TaxID=1461025 RepID=A0A5J5KXN2_9MICC|nr:helix-turn-helix transcriptional regulator [Kocuria coralli]
MGGMDTNDYRTALISGEVRAWLARRQKTQAELADHLGIARSAITRRMKGDRLFSLPELMDVADWLEISLQDLLGPEILGTRKSPRSDLVTTGAREDEWALRGSNPRPMD